jgi:hypothetical protein
LGVVPDGDEAGAVAVEDAEPARGRHVEPVVAPALPAPAPKEAGASGKTKRSGMAIPAGVPVRPMAADQPLPAA